MTPDEAGDIVNGKIPMLNGVGRESGFVDHGMGVVLNGLIVGPVIPFIFLGIRCVAQRDLLHGVVCLGRSGPRSGLEICNRRHAVLKVWGTTGEMVGEVKCQNTTKRVANFFCTRLPREHDCWDLAIFSLLRALRMPAPKKDLPPGKSNFIYELLGNITYI